MDITNNQINFYLEKTFSQNPSDVAHLIKYMYYSRIRYDTKFWYYFRNHRWYKYDEDKSPLIPLIKNEIVNKYLQLSTDYNQKVMKLSAELNSINDENPEKMEVYLPLIISDLMFKSQICSELCLKLNNPSYYQKLNSISQELFTEKDFSLSLDLNPHLIGFNNGNYNLLTSSLGVPTSAERVFMSVGYNFQPENTYLKEVESFFHKLGLIKMLPVLASLLSGEVRQPVIWVTNLSEKSLTALENVLIGTLGDYVGTLPFSMLRKKKIPHYQNHTHSDLVDNCRKRLVIVSQTEEDYNGVFPPMIDTLLGQNILNLRKPYETSNDYVPQFGLLVLSCKSDSEPLEGSLVFKADEVKEIEIKDIWKLDVIKLLLKYYRVK